MICTPHPNIVWVIKSRRMKWAEYVAHMGERRVYTGFWLGNLMERDHLKDQYIESG
jgi:hypothetical protein